MARKRANLTDLLNNLTFKVLYEKFMVLSCSAFEWNGLDELDIKPKNVEKLLFKEGKAIFFKRPKGSYMCLKCDEAGQLDPYGDPLYYHATGFGYHQKFSVDDVVIIENNMFRINTHDIVMMYVNKIFECERSLDVNVKTMKFPFLFSCNSNDVLSLKKIFADIDSNVPAVFVDKNIDLDSLNVFKTDAKFIGNDLMDFKKSVENELLTVLGFNNMAVDKKERVNLSEANSNNDIIEQFADLQLKARQKACEEINNKFGLNISVKRKEVKTHVESNNIQHKQGNA